MSNEGLLEGRTQDKSSLCRTAAGNKTEVAEDDLKFQKVSNYRVLNGEHALR